MIRRREFITLLGGAAAMSSSLWPLAAHAQQDGRMRHVAILMPYPPTDAEFQARVQVLRDELAKLGWTRDLNIQFDVRWTTDNMDLIRVNAANIVELKPDIIVATGGRVIPVFMQLTTTIPLVIPGSGDPIAFGIAQSIARPGGNVTGFTLFEASVFGKLLQTLQQIDPNVARVALIYDPDNPNAARYTSLLETFAGQLSIEPVSAPIHGLADIERVVETMARQPRGAILFPSDVTTTTLRAQVTTLVARHRPPAIYGDRIMVASGGLISYDADRLDLFRRSASYIDRILGGEKPGDLPFQQPTKYQLTINLKAAKALGLDIPAQVLALADEVIE